LIFFEMNGLNEKSNFGGPRYRHPSPIDFNDPGERHKKSLKSNDAMPRR